MKPQKAAAREPRAEPGAARGAAGERGKGAAHENKK